ncbi:MAG: hypothetical protein AAB544_03150 [Patescibacteria group bacterium]
MPRTFDNDGSSALSHQRCGASVVIDCASSEHADDLIAWLRQSPRGHVISVRLPSHCPDHSPADRRIHGQLLSLGCSVTLTKPSK